MTSKEKIVLSNLLKEVEDKSLQNTLRRVIFGGEGVIEALTIERPEMSHDDLQNFKTPMIGKCDIKKGDKVKYTCYSFGGDPIVVFTTVRNVLDGGYPIVYLHNGHEAQWDGSKYTISDLNCVELVYAI